MRKGYGAVLAAFVAFSVLLGPRSDSSGRRAASAGREAGSPQNSIDRVAKDPLAACKTSTKSKTPCGDCDPYCPAKDLLDLIQAHFGETSESKSDYDTAAHWNVPRIENQKILFVIATLPDPVHTHLSLFFDRTIEAIEKGAQQSGYLFSRATMPWETGEHPDSADLKVRLTQQLYQESKEGFPGLMIFRKVRSAAEAAALGKVPAAELKEPPKDASTLFVLVVGETPTGGIHKEQFVNALRMIREIRGKSEISAELKPLRIMGTAFSGSLVSLEQLMDEQLTNASEFPKILIHSGTASSWVWTREFRAFLKSRHTNAEFSTFQESDTYSDEHFRCYVETQGYEARDIAIVSEDETAYGNLEHSAKSEKREIPIPCDPDSYGKDADFRSHLMLQLYFPRDISQLRAAYQHDMKSQEASGTSKNVPRTSLPLNLDTTGSNDDSVPPYARLQTPLSQEAVLASLAGNLKKHHIRFIVIRASSSLDTLFLCQFLRTAYPDGRLVTIGSDLLFQRGTDKPSLQGVLAITSYPMLPGVDDQVARVSSAWDAPHVDHIFSDGYVVGSYNAFSSLVAAGSENIPTEVAKSDAPRSPEGRYKILPEARYAQFGWPASLATTPRDAHGLTPPLWLTVFGRGGVWPLGLLDETRNDLPKLAPASNLDAVNAQAVPGITPHSLPLEWRLFSLVVFFMAGLYSYFMAFPPLTPRSEALTVFQAGKDVYRNRLLFAGGALLAGMQCLFLYPWILWGSTHPRASDLFLTPAFALLMVDAACPLGLYLRGSWKLAIAFLATAVSVIITLVAFRIHFMGVALSTGREFLLYRFTHLLSGSSPLIPLLFLLGAGFWWTWLGLQGIILRGPKGPTLPDEDDFKKSPHLGSGLNLARLLEVSWRTQKRLMNALKPLGPEPRVLLPAGFALLLAVLVAGLRHPVQALEGDAYEDFYGYLFFAALFLLLTLSFRVVLVWMEFRGLLRALEDLPLRRSMDRLKGLAWDSLWKLAGSAGSSLTNFYRMITCELESLRKLQHQDPAVAVTPAESDSYKALLENIGETETRADELYCLFAKEPEPRGPFWKRKPDQLLWSMFPLHQQLARTCGSALIYLTLRWNREKCPSDDEKGADAKNEPDAIPCPVTACTERFVCLFFVAYILVILQRIQSLVLAIAGVFLLILISINSYPFEPHLRLRSILVVFFLTILVSVGMVYAQMHRDATLSRITDTKPGELGMDFWLRMGSFVLIPTLGLLAAQFPEINDLLFSWLEPAMQSMK
jgi:hypothetical protein